MIESIEITNFKGFSNLTLPVTKQLTLVGGLNDVGKTALLEAIFLFFDRNQASSPIDHLSRRGVEGVEISPEALWKPLFNNYDLKNEIEIKLQIDGHQRSLKVFLNPEFSPITVYKNVKGGKLPPGISPETITSSIVVEYFFEQEKIGISNYHIHGGGLGATFEKFNKGPKMVTNRATIFCAGANTNSNEDAERFGKIDTDGNLDKIIKFMQLIEPDIKSLSIIPTPSGNSIWCDVGLPNKLPIKLLGSGISRLLSFILAIVSTPGTVVLLDEIENGIHYSVIHKIWGALQQAAVEFNCQIFASTHSNEFLKLALRGMEGDMGTLEGFGNYEDLFCYIRLEKQKNGQFLTRTYDTKILKNALEGNLEIR